MCKNINIPSNINILRKINMITQEEKAKRRKAFEIAKASVELEGIYLSDELLELSNEYIDGKLTSEEYTQQFFAIVDRV